MWYFDLIYLCQIQLNAVGACCNRHSQLNLSTPEYSSTSFRPSCLLVLLVLKYQLLNQQHVLNLTVLNTVGICKGPVLDQLSSLALPLCSMSGARCQIQYTRNPCVFLQSCPPLTPCVYTKIQQVRVRYNLGTKNGQQVPDLGGASYGKQLPVQVPGSWSTRPCQIAIMVLVQLTRQNLLENE